MGKFIRYVLGMLLLIVALNAFAGGYYGLAGAENVPKEWLAGSPFHDYFIPALFLFVVVGGFTGYAAIAVFRSHRMAQRTAVFSAIIILLWITVQVSIIGYVSWMQPATTVAAILILLLAWRLPKYGN
ncbi:MAG: hypothetical protein IT242_08455 [Bacteroidia bacterium]|nr:hypothetical protein [Bacteroidia bacterium]